MGIVPYDGDDGENHDDDKYNYVDDNDDDDVFKLD